MFARTPACLHASCCTRPAPTEPWPNDHHVLRTAWSPEGNSLHADEQDYPQYQCRGAAISPPLSDPSRRHPAPKFKKYEQAFTCTVCYALHSTQTIATSRQSSNRECSIPTLQEIWPNTSSWSATLLRFCCEQNVDTSSWQPSHRKQAIWEEACS